jgi:hypothetical protein
MRERKWISEERKSLIRKLAYYGGEGENMKKIWCLAIALSFVLGLSMGYYIKDYRVHTDPKISVNVQFEMGGAGSTLVSHSGNLITDLGENISLFSLNGANQTLLAISVGNASSITADMTMLDTEATTDGFERVACNMSSYWFNGGDIARNYTACFVATAIICVNAVCLHWSVTGNSDNNAYALAWITDGTYHQFPVASWLNTTWVITFNAN